MDLVVILIVAACSVALLMSLQFVVTLTLWRKVKRLECRLAAAKKLDDMEAESVSAAADAPPPNFATAAVDLSPCRIASASPPAGLAAHEAIRSLYSALGRAEQQAQTGLRSVQERLTRLERAQLHGQHHQQLTLQPSPSRASLNGMPAMMLRNSESVFAVPSATHGASSSPAPPALPSMLPRAVWCMVNVDGSGAQRRLVRARQPNIVEVCSCGDGPNHTGNRDGDEFHTSMHEDDAAIVVSSLAADAVSVVANNRQTSLILSTGSRDSGGSVDRWWEEDNGSPRPARPQATTVELLFGAPEDRAQWARWLSTFNR